MSTKPQPKLQQYDHDHENEVTVFAATNFRSAQRKFGIKTDDRRRHMYIIGKTGMGKTTLLENMVLSDIYAGHGVAYVDPHGDTAQKLLDFIPPHRINDVVYFNPADLENPIGFNILETVEESQKHLVAAGLMGVFKKIWPDVWSSRMEYILLNTILALLDYPGSTMLGINRLLSDKDYRKKVVSVIQDPVVKTFWVKEFAGFADKYRTEAVAPVQNKVGQFLSASIIRNIVAQVKSTINIRQIMDERKIFIVNLSKGAVGEENMALLGNMLVTRMQLAAMERVDIPREEDRQDFYLYVDEFQNFATPSFANILSEARKYRLNLIMAHQYIEQLAEEVTAAVFGNVGTLISFRVGATDAEALAKEFTPQFTEEDLVNLRKFDVYLKLMIDGASSAPFSAATLPPIAQRTNSKEKVIKVSRERYARPRAMIEDKVLRWSGLEEDASAEAGAATDKEHEEIEKRLKELEATSPKIVGAPESGGTKPVVAEMPCVVCGKVSKLTFEPDRSKPWYCKEHLDQRSKEGPKGPPRAGGPRQDRSPRRDDRRPMLGTPPPSAAPRPPRERPPERPPIRDLKPASKPQPAMKEVSLSALMDAAEEKKSDAPSETPQDEQWVSLSSLRGAMITDDTKGGERQETGMEKSAPTDGDVPAAPLPAVKASSVAQARADMPSRPMAASPRPMDGGPEEKRRKKKKRKKHPGEGGRDAHAAGADRPQRSDAPPVAPAPREHGSPDITVMPHGADVPKKNDNGPPKGGTPLGPGQVVTF